MAGGGNPNHDEHGRFSDGPGGGADKSSAKSPAKYIQQELAAGHHPMVGVTSGQGNGMYYLTNHEGSISPGSKSYTSAMSAQVDRSRMIDRALKKL
jgi:hypothetical protein